MGPLFSFFFFLFVRRKPGQRNSSCLSFLGPLCEFFLHCYMAPRLMAVETEATRVFRLTYPLFPHKLSSFSLPAFAASVPVIASLGFGIFVELIRNATPRRPESICFPLSTSPFWSHSPSFFGRTSPLLSTHRTRLFKFVYFTF